MVFFNWLHLTDLHLGMDGLRDLWPNVEEDFFEDLKFLIKMVGTLDLVLFTGDFVQRGSSEEFEQVNQLLVKFWIKFSEMGCKPKFLAVPGNHDLVRPENLRDPTLLSLTRWWDDPDVNKPFWDDQESPQRQLVDKAFANYMQWWQSTTVPKPDVYSKGILPGDFSATLEKEGAKLGIVGLNSTFLQLIGGNLERKLALNVRQFNVVCGGHGPDWVHQHDICLLLTHQPPAWLTKEAFNQLDGEIHHPPERFALHLFGHMHEPELRSTALSGSDGRRRLQGCSLFGMEGWGDDKNMERLHGYLLGQLKIEGNTAELRIWPRKAAKKQDGGWSIDRDISFPLPRGQEGTEPMPVTLLRSQPEQPKSHPGTDNKGGDLIRTEGGASMAGPVQNEGGVNIFGGNVTVNIGSLPPASMDAAQTVSYAPLESLSLFQQGEYHQTVSGEQLKPFTAAEHRQEQVLQKPSRDAPFHDWAHYYIRNAKKETKNAQSSLTASYISSTVYINELNALDEIKKSFEEFHDLIGETPQLSPEITLSREQLRVTVRRAIKQIKEVQSCIIDRTTPCNDIEGKFESLLQTLDELGKDCKLKDQ